MSMTFDNDAAALEVLRQIGELHFDLMKLNEKIDRANRIRGTARGRGGLAYSVRRLEIDRDMQKLLELAVAYYRDENIIITKLKQ